MATKNDGNRELQGKGHRQRNGSWQFKKDDSNYRHLAADQPVRSECMHMAYHPDKEDPLDR